MAKVGSFELKIDTRYPQQYPIYYTQSKKFEIRGIDEEFFNITKISSYGYATELELNTAIHKAIPVYHEAKTRQRLVIGYRCNATPHLKMNQVSKGRFQGLLDGVSRKIGNFDAFTVPMLGIGIDYVVWMEVFNGKENEYYPVDKDHKVCSVNDISWQKREGMTFIDYSEENIKFFRNIKKGMQEMVKQLSTFFDMDAEQAQQLITSNQKLIG